MASIKVVANYIGDERSTLTFVSPAKFDKKLNHDNDSFGFGFVENAEKSGIERYPFVIEEFDDTLALLDWGAAFDKNKATIDILNRQLNPGEIITYLEIDDCGEKHGPYSYRIINIDFFE